MDVDDDAPMPMEKATKYQHRFLYAVQRCWHSGPQHHAPVDMLRLFHTQREAEEAAYHSALAFQELNPKPSSDASEVKTLILPSFPVSYGFLTGGELFWVRMMRATVVVADSPEANRSSSSMCQSAAYAILTEGVIGGTGNPNSKRGTEISDGRVFAGDATAAVIANEAVARVRRSLTDPTLRVETRTIPVGKPPEWLSAGAYVADWPVQAGFSNSDRIRAGDLPFGTTPKRQMESASGNFRTWGRSVSQDVIDENFATSGSNIIAEPTSTIIGGTGFGSGHENLMVVEPVAKRRRFVSVAFDDAMTQ